MSKKRRKELIQQIEEKRQSKLIAFVTGDRPPTGAQIGDDAVRPLFDHLRGLGPVAKLDLFLYSRGGAVDVPWHCQCVSPGE